MVLPTNGASPHTGKRASLSEATPMVEDLSKENGGKEEGKLVASLPNLSATHASDEPPKGITITPSRTSYNTVVPFAEQQKTTTADTDRLTAGKEARQQAKQQPPPPPQRSRASASFQMSAAGYPPQAMHYVQPQHSDGDAQLQELMARMMISGQQQHQPPPPPPPVAANYNYMMAQGNHPAAAGNPQTPMNPMGMLAADPNLAALAQFQQLFLAAQMGYAPVYGAMAASAYGGLPPVNMAAIDPQNLMDHRVYRSQMEPSCTWSGTLPPRNYKNPQFSCKIFVGGVPWDVTEGALLEAFKIFGSCRVEWPGKEPRYYRSPARQPRGKVTGYVYIIFDKEASVKKLLQSCTPEFTTAGEWYFKLTAKRQRTKEIRQVQVIPWVIGDSTWMVQPTQQRLDPKKTVFVGALHGMITAEILATIFNDLFGNVIFAGIDTDRFKYPIGSGRVTFSSEHSYFKAIQAAFIEIKTAKFNKKVQIDPFLEDALCAICQNQYGPYFCREMTCFKYYCRGCWQHSHTPPVLREHKPLMRNTRRLSSTSSHYDDGEQAGADDSGIGASYLHNTTADGNDNNQ